MSEILNEAKKQAALEFEEKERKRKETELSLENHRLAMEKYVEEGGLIGEAIPEKILSELEPFFQEVRQSGIDIVGEVKMESEYDGIDGDPGSYRNYHGIEIRYSFQGKNGSFSFGPFEGVFLRSYENVKVREGLFPKHELVTVENSYSEDIISRLRNVLFDFVKKVELENLEQE